MTGTIRKPPCSYDLVGTVSIQANETRSFSVRDGILSVSREHSSLSVNAMWFIGDNLSNGAVKVLDNG